MLATEHLSFSYSPDHLFTFPDLQLLQGESMLITGNSGCGKTTLLHILCGILKPTHGKVNWKNQSLYKLSETERDQIRGQEMGVVLQQAHLIPSLSIIQNLMLNAYFAKSSYKKEDVTNLLVQMGIGSKLHHYPHQLSQGEQQRAAIARAFVHRPAILFADEPTSHLDDPNCQIVVDLLQKLSADYKISLCVITHDARAKQNFSKHQILALSTNS